MITYDRQHLLAEQNFLREQLAGFPASARLTRMSTEARLRSIETQLAEMPLNEREPVRARLSADNLRESPQRLHGEFVGALPKSRTFEFKFAGDETIIRGKVAASILNVDEINQHLHQLAFIDVITTQVGNGRPRYLLTQMPEWSSQDHE